MQYLQLVLAGLLFASMGAAPQPTPGIRNFFRVDEQICTGGQPTMEEIARLKAMGVKAIINLRLPGEFNAAEEAARAKELRLRYFHIPFDTHAPDDAAVAQFLDVLADSQNRPLFIHCTTANRVGGLWMIRRVLVDGWSLEKAEEEAKRIGLRNSKTRAFVLDYLQRHPRPAAKPAT